MLIHFFGQKHIVHRKVKRVQTVNKELLLEQPRLFVKIAFLVQGNDLVSWL